MKKLFNQIDLPALKWVWLNLKDKKWIMLLLIVIQIINGVLMTERSLLLREVIDYAVRGSRKDFLFYLTIFIVMMAVQLVIMGWYRHLQAKAEYGMQMTLKKRLYRTLLQKEYASVKAVHSGQWNQRMTSDTSSVASLAVNTVPGIIGLLARMVSALAALLLLVPALVLLMIPFGICFMGVTILLKKTTKRMYNDIQDADGRFRVFLQEHLSNLLMIKAFNKEKMSLCQGESIMEDHFDKIMKRNTFMIFVYALASMAMNGMYLLGVVLGGVGILHGTVSYGTFSAVLALVSQAQAQMAGASSYLSSVFYLTASAERLMKAEDFADDDCNPRSESEIINYYQKDFRTLEIRNAAFTYTDINEDMQETTKVFTDMNMCLNKGEFVALTGESGCGKSTILKVLMAIYNLDQGERLLLGSEQIPLDASWRGLFAYVPQGNQLMQGSIRDVIAFGESIDENKMQNALKISCADGFVGELENGLNTVLGERGSGLSEGQMQRISIARAIYSDRPILLLDESTSALDTDTEKRLLENIRQMTDKTVVIVTHRPAALDFCDRVISFAEKIQGKMDS